MNREAALGYALAFVGGGQFGALVQQSACPDEKGENELFFSSGSLWEIVIKRNLGRDDF